MLSYRVSIFEVYLLSVCYSMQFSSFHEAAYLSITSSVFARFLSYWQVCLFRTIFACRFPRHACLASFFKNDEVCVFHSCSFLCGLLVRLLVNPKTGVLNGCWHRKCTELMAGTFICIQTQEKQLVLVKQYKSNTNLCF